MRVLTSCISLTLTQASSAPCLRMSCSRKKKVRLWATCWRTCASSAQGEPTEAGVRAGAGACGEEQPGARVGRVLAHLRTHQRVVGNREARRQRRSGCTAPAVPQPRRSAAAGLQPSRAARPRRHAPARRPPRRWGWRSGGCRWGTCGAPPRTCGWAGGQAGEASRSRSASPAPPRPCDASLAPPPPLPPPRAHPLVDPAEHTAKLCSALPPHSLDHEGLLQDGAVQHLALDRQLGLQAHAALGGRGGEAR